MKNVNCSKEKIVEAYYNESLHKDIMEHISSCKECSEYYQDLIKMGERMNKLKNTKNLPYAFSVKQIVNKHELRKERKRVVWESGIFSFICLASLGVICTALNAFDFRILLLLYLAIFINLPILLLPVILKRKELI